MMEQNLDYDLLQEIYHLQMLFEHRNYVEKLYDRYGGKTTLSELNKLLNDKIREQKMKIAGVK